MSFRYVKGVACDPVYGISFGSLRMDGGRVQVEAIQVDSCSFKATQNKARIKTWQGGSGHARNITFNNIKFYDTENPIIIDQYYRPHRIDCQTCIDFIRNAGA